MSLRSKLLLAQAPLWVAVVLVAAVAVISVNRLGTESQLILKDNYRSVLAAERMKESLERIDSGAMFEFTGHEKEGQALQAEHERAFENELVVQEGNITEPGEAEATKTLRAEWVAYRGEVEEFVKLRDAEAARTRYFDVLQPRFRKVKRAAEEVLALNEDAMIRKSDAARQNADTTVAVLAGAVVVAALAGALGASALTTRMLRPVSVLTQTVRRIGAGDLAVRARVDDGDEIAELAREFNALADSVSSYRKSTLGDLIQAQQSAQAAIDSLADPVIVFGAAGPVLAANRAAETMLAVDVEGSDPLTRTPAAAREAIERARIWVSSGKGPFVPKGYEDAVRVDVAEGALWLLPRAAAIYTDVGISGVTVVLQDVTRLRRFDELTRDLVATVAHEFRTPLTSLQMAVHLCAEGLAGPVTEKQTELLFAARTDCERLMDLVEDLLDVSRLQAGSAALRRERVRARDLVEEVLEAHRMAAEARKVSLAVEGEREIEVDADRERARLVLANLLSNAIRHAKDAGAVRVKIRSDGPAVRFDVIDDGPGIPSEWRTRVFEKFVRIPGVEGSGAGLGLHIAKEIIAAHGGEIGIDDVPGGGTCVWFTLNAVAAQSGSPDS